MENINSWDEINWPKVNKTVYLLQLRIFRASKDQNWEKVFKLQKLLVKSASAKCLAIRKVTQDNCDKNLSRTDSNSNYSKKEKFNLSQNLSIDGKSSRVYRLEIPVVNRRLRTVKILALEDKAKQTLAVMALSPQWEAQFEPNSYGFRPGRSVLDAMEAIFLSLHKKQKWVLDVDISKCFERVNHEILARKCNTFPQMEKQVKAWLEAGVLIKSCLWRSLSSVQKTHALSPLLVNIALHGLEMELQAFARNLPGCKKDNERALSFVRYGDNFLVMHEDTHILQELKVIVTKFLDHLGLQLDEKKTKIVHTEKPTESDPPGFNYLGFYVVHRNRKKRMQTQRFIKANFSGQDFILTIIPSEESVKCHKKEIRNLIKSSFGLSQEKLIEKLNPIIRNWALLKKTPSSFEIFQELDSYLFMQTWKWSRRRHLTMSRSELKDKYYRKIGNRNWVFSFEKKETNDTTSIIRLQAYNDIKVQRHVKVEVNASIYDGNILYWNNRTVSNRWISSDIVKLIRDQQGTCTYCGQAFLPEDILKKHDIRPRISHSKTLRKDVQVVHNYCHLIKTQIDLKEVNNRKIFLKALPGAE